MSQNPDLLNNEEFEKVDHDLYQDESVTSTSVTGEMAEEDRYQGTTGDLLGDEYTSTAGQPAFQEEPEQLISFDSSPPPPEPVPESSVTEPKPSSAKAEIKSAAVSGCAWLENVDPRADVADGVRDLGEDKILKEKERGSESDSSMSLDGSSASSDSEASDSESDSEASVSEAEENDIEMKEKEFEGAEGVDVLSVDKEPEERFLGWRNNDAMNEFSSKNKNYEDEIIAAINEEVNNAYIAEQKQDEIRIKYLEVGDVSKQLDLGFQNFVVKGQGQKEYVENKPKLLDSNNHQIIVADTNCPPYQNLECDEGSGSVNALDKQSETTYKEEETDLLFDSFDKPSQYIESSDKVQQNNLHGNNSNFCIKDPEACSESASCFNPDMMEKLRLGILKSDLCVYEDHGSEQSSDIDRGSSHPEEHHVHFNDEVTYMEFPDEIIEEHKTDETEKYVEWFSPENKEVDNDSLSKDDTEDTENKITLQTEGDNDAEFEGSELDLDVHKIEQTRNMPLDDGEGTKQENLDVHRIEQTRNMPLDEVEGTEQEVEQVPIPSFYSASKSEKSLSVNKEEQSTFILNKTEEDLTVDAENDSKIDMSNRKAESEKIVDETSLSSDNESEEDGSDEESASDSSSDLNVSGEWTLSPLSEIEGNNKANLLMVDIPETVDAKTEPVSAENVCLLSYTSIGKDINMSARSEEVDNEFMDVQENSSVTATNISNIEEQSNELENSGQSKNNFEIGIEEKNQQKSFHEAGVYLLDSTLPAAYLEEENISDDEAVDNRMEKNQTGMHEAVTLLEDLENEMGEALDQNSDQIQRFGSVEQSLCPNRSDSGVNNDSLTDIVMEQDTGKSLKLYTESITNNDPSELPETLTNSSQVPVKDEGDDILETKSNRIISLDSPVQLEFEKTVKQGMADISSETEINENISVNIDRESDVAGRSDHLIAEIDKHETDYLNTTLSQGSHWTELLIKVVDLIYWRDVKKTGIVFGSMMFVLMALACFSLLSVLAYMSLAVLTVTFSFRVYKTIMQAVQKTNEGHPFKKLMEMKIELKDEVVQEAAENITKHINNCHTELRRLYLVEDYVDSIKFGMLLWLLTYIGSWFSGMTLVILGVVSVFTLPRIYETYQVQIDAYINMARAQLNKILAQISAKIPFPKKKTKTQ